MKKVLLLPDTPGWAYDIIAKNIAKHIDKAKYHVTIKYVGDILSKRQIVDFNLRWSILDRDKNKCQWCGGEEKLEVHHFDLNPNNNEISNLKTLCFKCHKKVHKLEKCG